MKQPRTPEKIQEIKASAAKNKLAVIAEEERLGRPMTKAERKKFKMRLAGQKYYEKNSADRVRRTPEQLEKKRQSAIRNASLIASQEKLLGRKLTRLEENRIRNCRIPRNPRAKTEKNIPYKQPLLPVQKSEPVSENRKKPLPKLSDEHYAKLSAERDKRAKLYKEQSNGLIW
jgi:hypothetical protein